MQKRLAISSIMSSLTLPVYTGSSKMVVLVAVGS